MTLQKGRYFKNYIAIMSYTRFNLSGNAITHERFWSVLFACFFVTSKRVPYLSTNYFTENILNNFIPFTDVKIFIDLVIVYWRFKKKSVSFFVILIQTLMRELNVLAWHCTQLANSGIKLPKVIRRRAIDCLVTQNGRYFVN